MARPTNASADETRARILDAALLVLAEKGPRRLGVKDVAEAADVSAALVHHYFGSRDGLLAACVDPMYEELAQAQDALVEELGRIGEPLLALEVAVRRGCALARGHRPTLRVLLLIVADAGALERTWRARLLGPFLDRFPAMLAAGDGQNAMRARIGLQSLVFLIGRYAAASIEELRQILGVDETFPESGLHEQVEAHLVGAAGALVGLLSQPPTAKPPGR